MLELLWYLFYHAYLEKKTQLEVNTVQKAQLKDISRFIVGTQCVVKSPYAGLFLYLVFSVSRYPHLNRTPGFDVLKWRKRARVLPVHFFPFTTIVGHSCLSERHKTPCWSTQRVNLSGFPGFSLSLLCLCDINESLLCYLFAFEPEFQCSGKQLQPPAMLTHVALCSWHGHAQSCPRLQKCCVTAREMSAPSHSARVC